ncbi:MAG: hypothetical protein JWR05_661 [Mucilaginibacter sp.]|nr:hypothetical protein [Mucilaginibacter sp.]
MEIKRSYLLLLSSAYLLFTGCSPKYKIQYQPSLKNSFSELSGERSSLMDKDNNIVLVDLSKSTLDTLNKSQYLDPKITVSLLTEDSSKARSEDSKYDVWFCSKTKMDDSTLIEVAVPFGNQTIKHRILGNNVSTFFTEFYKDRQVLKSSQRAAKSSTLTVNAKTVSFILNKRANSEGVLFGRVEVISDPIFAEDVRFKGGFIKKRYHLFYKFKISK